MLALTKTVTQYSLYPWQWALVNSVLLSSLSKEKFSSLSKKKEKFSMIFRKKKGKFSMGELYVYFSTAPYIQNTDMVLTILYYEHGFTHSVY